MKTGVRPVFMCARVEVISTLAVYLRDRPLYIFLFQLDAYLSPRLLLLEKFLEFGSRQKQTLRRVKI